MEGGPFRFAVGGGFLSGTVIPTVTGETPKVGKPPQKSPPAPPEGHSALPGAENSKLSGPARHFLVAAVAAKHEI